MKNFLTAAGKSLDTFLEMKNEAGLTKKLTVFGILLLTIGLATLSITGAFAKSSGDGGAWVGRLAYALVVLGLELIAAVLFVRAMATKDRPRQIVCFVVMIPLVWANVQNAKDGLRFIMPETFGHSSVVLNAQADLAREEAATLKTAQEAAIGGSGAELERVRTQIAELKTEQQLMTSMSPEGISKAQKSLISQGLYFGSVDGIAEAKTESAMRARGEAITRELATLKAREDGLMQGQASPVQQANTDKRLLQIELRDKAAKAADAELRADVIFWIAEIARQMLLWAAVTSLSATATAAGLRRQEELAEAEHQLALAALRAGHVAPAPAPVAVEPEPAPAPEPEPVAAEPDNQHFRNMALASAQARAAKKAKADSFIPVPSLVARDAAKVAAE